MGSLEAKKTSRAYVRRVRGTIDHTRVVAKMPAPITSTTTLRGRSAAARTTRPRSTGERGVVLSGALRSRSRRSGSIAGVTFPQRNMNLSAYLEPECTGGIALVYGEAQPPVRVRDEHEFACPGRPEGLQVAYIHLAFADVRPHGGAVLEPPFLLADGQPGVAVTVHGDDVSRYGFAVPNLLASWLLEARQRGRLDSLPKLGELHARRQVRRDGREDVATVEGVRDRVDVVPPVGEKHGLRDTTQRLRRRDEDAVVRPYQQSSTLRSQRQRTPLRAYPRVHDGQVYHVLRHVTGGVLQYLRPGFDLEPRHLVRQVHDSDPGRNPEHHTFARTDEIVGQSEVGEEANRPHAPSIKPRTTLVTGHPTYNPHLMLCAKRAGPPHYPSHPVPYNSREGGISQPYTYLT